MASGGWAIPYTSGVAAVNPGHPAMAPGGSGRAERPLTGRAGGTLRGYTPSMIRLGVAAAVCALLAGTGARAEIVLRGGTEAVRMDVDFAWAPGGPLDDGSGWHADGDAQVLTRRTENGVATVRLEPAPGAVRIEATVSYARPTPVDHETIHLHLRGPARVLGHDLRLTPLAGTLRVERGTPIVLITPAILLAGGTGLVAGARGAAAHAALRSRRGRARPRSRRRACAR